MTSADAFSLTRLFIAPNTFPSQPTLGQPWIGGVMTSWDAASYANTVVVGPITYQNLPIVSPNGLTTGSVLLAKVASGYVVIGMLGSAKTTALLDPIRYRRLRSDVSLPNTTFADIGVLNFLLRENTEYGLEGVIFGNSTTSNDYKFSWSGPPNMAAKWSMFGISNATTNGVLTDVVTGYGDANPQTIQGAGLLAEIRPGGWFATTDTPGILQMRAALASGSTAGILAQGSWLRLSELGTSDATETFIKNYTATGSRSYDDSGNPIGGSDGDNNIYTGTFPDRAFGNERSVMILPGSTIRADLAGATILSASLYLYCYKAEETNGSLVGARVESYTSVPATYNPPTADGSSENSLHDAWPVPGWQSMECYYQSGSNSLLNRILAGGNAIGLPPTIFGLAATGFRGYGFSVTYRPYLQVTYAA